MTNAENRPVAAAPVANQDLEMLADGLFFFLTIGGTMPQFIPGVVPQRLRLAFDLQPHAEIHVVRRLAAARNVAQVLDEGNALLPVHHYLAGYSFESEPRTNGIPESLRLLRAGIQERRRHRSNTVIAINEQATVTREQEKVDSDDWQLRALCKTTDPGAFFPEKGGSVRAAKRVCVGCEVRKECLGYALEHGERFGVWGGLSQGERKRLKRRS